MARIQFRNGKTYKTFISTNLLTRLIEEHAYVYARVYSIYSTLILVVRELDSHLYLQDLVSRTFDHVLLLNVMARDVAITILLVYRTGWQLSRKMINFDGQLHRH